MNSICQFTYDVLPTDSEKIQAWAAILTTGFAGYALFSWRNQKQYDLNINAISKIPLLKNLIYSEIFEHITSIEEIKNAYNNDQFDKTIFGNIVIKMSDISTKYEKEYINSNFYSTLEIILHKKISNNEYSNIYEFYKNFEKLRDKYITEPISNIVVNYIDKKEKFNQEIARKCFNELSQTIGKSIDEFNVLFNNLKKSNVLQNR
jgi:hypothetical protein